MSRIARVALGLAAALTAVVSMRCDNGPTTTVLTVEKMVNGCYAPCPNSAAPASALGLGNQCPAATTTTCGLIGGTDQIRITVDYGPQNISSPIGFTPPTVQLIGNSGSLSTTTMTGGPLTAGEQRPYAWTVLYAPVQQTTLVIQASVGGGDTLTLSGLTVALPAPSLTLAGCMGSTMCSLPAQVGTEAVTVTVPANTTPATAMVLTTVDNVPFGAALSIPLTAAPGNVLTGTLATTVPPSGTLWTFGGYVGALPLPPAQITLTTPKISASLQGCSTGQGCTVTAGGTASVTITAPLLSQQMTAMVTTSVAGIDTAGAYAVPLSECAGSLCGVLVAPIPPTAQVGASWQMRGNLGVQPISSLSATVLAGPEAGSPTDAGTGG